MKMSKFTCPRLITAISIVETSLSKGDNLVKLLKVKSHDERSEVMMKGEFVNFVFQTQYFFLINKNIILRFYIYF